MKPKNRLNAFWAELTNQFNPNKSPEQLVRRYIRNTELQAVMTTACKMHTVSPDAYPEGIVRSVHLPFGEDRIRHLCLLATAVEYYEPLKQTNYHPSWGSREMLQDYLQKILRTLLGEYEFRLNRSRATPVRSH